MKNLLKSIGIIIPVLFLLVSCALSGQDKEAFTSLFNGEDLSGWETYIGVPEPSVEVSGLATDADGKYTEPIGLNKDPLNVFTVVDEDGAPAVKVTGEIYGSLATEKEFGNYHFRMQVKWGEKKWAPRADKPRNSGLLYHGTGEYGAGLGVWKKSHECQVMENMFGDSYRMGDTYCSIRSAIPEGSQRYYVYNPEADLVESGEGKEGGKICFKSSMNEKPLGEWNTVEIICVGAKSVHIINGVVNMVNEDSHLIVDGKKVPLTNGNIQLQSEGAEVYFRNMEIKSIDQIPEEYLK